MILFLLCSKCYIDFIINWKMACSHNIFVQLKSRNENYCLYIHFNFFIIIARNPVICQINEYLLPLPCSKNI